MLRLLPAAALVLGSACSDTQSASFTSGELIVSVSAAELSVPEALRDGNRVASLPCATGECPATGRIATACTAGVCDPQRVAVTVPAGDPVDFDALIGELSILFGVLDRIEITEIRYAVQRNTLNVDLEPLALYWGPEGAAAVDPAMGVERLAVLPAVTARTTPMGRATVDAVGQQALSDYLVGVSRRVRLFVQTEVDLDPGDPFPEGDLRVAAVLEITASGRLVD